MAASLDITSSSLSPALPRGRFSCACRVVWLLVGDSLPVADVPGKVGERVGGGAEKTANPLTDKPAAYRLLVAWIAVYVLFFSVAATKLPNYVLPAVVPCTLLIARFLQRWRTESIRVPTWLGYGAAAFLLLIGVSAGVRFVGGRRRGCIARHAWALLCRPGKLGVSGCDSDCRRRGVLLVSSLSAVWPIDRRSGGLCDRVPAPLAAFASVLFNQSKAPEPLVAKTDTVRHYEDIRIGGWQIEHLPS